MGVKDNGHDGEPAVEVFGRDLKDALNQDSLSGAFQSQEFMNALKLLMQLDDEMTQNLFRLDFPNRRYAVAWVCAYADAVRHESLRVQQELKLLVGVLPAIGAKRTNAFVDALIGQQRNVNSRNDNASLGDKIKRWAKSE